MIYALNSMLFCQVIISEDNSAEADSSAMLEIKSAEKGFLPPRMSLVERTSIKHPAEGLMIYCTNCGPGNAPAISVYMNGIWRNLIDCNPPLNPVDAVHIPCPDQIIWKWHPVPGATGYGWSITEDSVEFYLGNDTVMPESGLMINVTYSRYIWAYNNCGTSKSHKISETTSPDTLKNPFPANPISDAEKITWKWNKVTGATGYKWNSTNDFQTAQDLGTDTLKIETGLTCLTEYSRYIWAYNNCIYSDAVIINASTIDIPIEGKPQEGLHQQTLTTVLWKWLPLEEATGYKWNIEDNYETAIDLGADTSYLEDSLICGTSYQRYVWAHYDCGISRPSQLTCLTPDEAPASPDAGPYESSLERITWHWSQVEGAVGYKWNPLLDYSQAVDVGTDSLYAETGLTCDSSYTRYIWSYNQCGYSTPMVLAGSTLDDPPSAPDEAVHDPSSDRITWRWNHVTGALGYKWNDQDDPLTATDLGYDNFYYETGLNCRTEYTRYVWAYGECGISFSSLLTDSTLMVPITTPPAGTEHDASLFSIQWNWHPVCDTCSYKWSTTDQYETAIDLGSDTSFTENYLSCGEEYSSFIWVYNTCGFSSSTVLTMSTTVTPPASPATGIHLAEPGQIEWNWYSVDYAAGYLWNTVNDTVGAINLGDQTSYIESGLNCLTPYIRYVWAIHDCAVSLPLELSDTTLEVPINETLSPAAHVPGGDSVLWKWHPMTGTAGYKWNSSDDYSTATDLGTDRAYTENDLVCLTPYTRYIWAYDLCGHSSSTQINALTTELNPDSPVGASHEHTGSQIIWKWHPVNGATGYKWNTTTDYNNATSLGTDTSFVETGLICDTYYTRYVWSYSNCGHSDFTMMNTSTIIDTLDAPPAGVHAPTVDQITWNWSAVEGATGYKWNITDDYSNSQNLGNTTTHLETGLDCGTMYTRYLWAYNQCGHSLVSAILNQATVNCWACGDPITIVHVVDNVAPVNKTLAYGTVTNVPGETAKCWISRNLGADHQATNYNDNTEASAGWYWQFNRPQGYKHDGSTRTPNYTWTTSINEYSDWITANDPCTIEMGAGWRVPTTTEWANIDAAGPWTNWSHPFASVLKMHAAGRLDYQTGNIQDRGFKGSYWSSVQHGIVDWGQSFNFSGSSCGTSQYQKAYGFSVRCVKN